MSAHRVMSIFRLMLILQHTMANESTTSLYFTTYAILKSAVELVQKRAFQQINFPLHFFIFFFSISKEAEFNVDSENHMPQFD